MSSANYTPKTVVIDSVKFISLLLTKRSEINYVIVEGNTYLHMAVASQNESITKTLLNYGANTNLRNDFGLTPLQIAVRLRNVCITKLLIENGANVNVVDEADFGVLHLAALQQDLKMVNTLLESGVDVTARTKDGKTALQYAIKARDKYVAMVLLDGGADVDDADDEGTTILHLLLLKKDHDMFLKVLPYKPNIDARNHLGETALHIASELHDVDWQMAAIRELVAHGADVNAKCNLGETPLMKMLAHGSLANVEALIELGADTKARNYNPGELPTHYAAELGRVDILSSLFVRDCRARDGLTPFNFNDIYQGNSVLHSAAIGCHPEIIRLCYMFSIPFEQRNTSNLKAFMYLVKNYQSISHCSKEQISKTLRFLLYYGDDLKVPKNYSNKKAEDTKVAETCVKYTDSNKATEEKNVVSESSQDKSLKEEEYEKDEEAENTEEDEEYEEEEEEEDDEEDEDSSLLQTNSWFRQVDKHPEFTDIQGNDIMELKKESEWNFEGECLLSYDECVWKPVVEHVARMRFAGKPVGCRLKHEIASNLKLRNYFKNCKQELLQSIDRYLFTDVKGTKHNFGSLMLAPTLLVLSLVDKIESVFKDMNLQKVFPIYGDLVEQHLLYNREYDQIEKEIKKK